MTHERSLTVEGARYATLSRSYQPRSRELSDRGNGEYIGHGVPREKRFYVNVLAGLTYTTGRSGTKGFLGEKRWSGRRSFRFVNDGLHEEPR